MLFVSSYSVNCQLNQFTNLAKVPTWLYQIWSVCKKC